VQQVRYVGIGSCNGDEVLLRVTRGKAGIGANELGDREYDGEDDEEALHDRQINGIYRSIEEACIHWMSIRICPLLAASTGISTAKW